MPLLLPLPLPLPSTGIDLLVKGVLFFFDVSHALFVFYSMFLSFHVSFHDSIGRLSQIGIFMTIYVLAHW